MMNAMKRALSMVLVLMMVIGFATVASASGTKSFVTTAKCYLRSEPNRNSTKLATIKAGTKFTATDYEKDSRGVTWYYGSYKDQVGWVSSKNLGSASSSTKAPSKKASYKKYAVITGSCNIRKSPDKSSGKLGTASKGEYFNCSGAKYDDRGVVWYKISYNGSTAWVSSKYAKASNSKPASSATAAPTATPKPIDYSSFEAAEYYVIITATSLNMRYEPSTASSIIASYDNGDVLYAMRTNGEWYEVLDEETNRSGYMIAKYVEVYTEPEATADPETVEVTEGVVNSLEELQSAVPKATLIDAPEGATDVVYSWANSGIDGVTVGKVAFNYEGINYVLSAARCASEDEMIDIDTTDTEPEAETAEQHVELSVDGSSAVAHYYDAATMTQYSLEGPSANEGQLVMDMATRLFTVEDANIADVVELEEGADIENQPEAEAVTTD